MIRPTHPVARRGEAIGTATAVSTPRKSAWQRDLRGLRPFFSAFALSLLLPVVCLGGEENPVDPLLGMIRRASVVISGTVSQTPIGISGELGVIRYSPELHSVTVLAGELPATSGASPEVPEKVRATVVRFESPGSKPSPLLVSGSRVVLFLTEAPRSIPALKVVDPWMSLHEARPELERRILGLATRDVAVSEPVPHAAAVALVAEERRDEIARIDGGHWWHDIAPRTFTVRRPFYPGTIDSTHTFNVTYSRSGKILGFWSVDTRRGTAQPGGARPAGGSLSADLEAMRHQDRGDGASLHWVPSTSAREAAARVLENLDLKGRSAEEIRYILGAEPGDMSRSTVLYRIGEDTALSIRVRFENDRAVEVVLP